MKKYFNLIGATLLFYCLNSVCAAAGLLSFPLSANQRGTVTCMEHPSISYDIYLPPAYSTNSTPLPILYTFNANGGGMVPAFKSVCSALNIIVVGVTGPKNNAGWDIVLKECYAVTRDIRCRVLFDPTAEFATGMSGGGLVSYGYSRIRAQHVAGIFSMSGWMGRYPNRYCSIDRVQTNLLVARSIGLSDSSSWPMSYDASYLSQWDSVINDLYFDGGHVVAPDSVKTTALSWLISTRTPASLNERSTATQQAQAWRLAIAAGQRETVVRECVNILMSRPRSWYAHEAQLVMDDLMADYDSFSSLSFANLAQGDFASDYFYFYAFGAALNADLTRYHSCLKALTGISGTNGDRAGDLYDLLERFAFPNPKLHGTSDPDQMCFWLIKDTPGLTYTLQSNANLLSNVWESATATSEDDSTAWSATCAVLPGAKSAFYRIGSIAEPATSSPWPEQ
ncbi:hypothetical protein [Pontiella sp.]|uniref:hypothetical protein n=1 Tax=Pontiella sp. TaxID=2837462 RepID=UPI0035644400